MTAVMITSRTNSQVKHVRKLQDNRRYRTDQGAFVVEGTRWLQEVMATPGCSRWPSTSPQTGKTNPDNGRCWTPGGQPAAGR